MPPLTMLVNLGPNAAEPAGHIADLLTSRFGAVHLRFARPDPRHPPDVGWMCGYLTADLVVRGGSPLDVVAAPVFAGRIEPMYESVIVTSSKSIRLLRDARTARFVINETESWSGHLVVLRMLGIRDLSDRFGEVLVSGSHARSIDMLLEESAEVAAIDSTVWEHRTARDPFAAGLSVIATTQAWPAPPFSVRSDLDEELRMQITQTLTSASVEGLEKIVPAGLEAYRPMLED